MIIGYDRGLTRQTFSEQRGFLKSLGLDAPGNPEDQVILGEVDDPEAVLNGRALQRLPNGELIWNLFSSPNVRNISFYDGTSNEWFRLNGTWPITLDSLAHLRGQDCSKALVNAERVLDVGCGNGVAGIYAVSKNSLIKDLVFADISPWAIRTARSNSHTFLASSPQRSVQTSYRVAPGIPVDIGAFDVILASAVPATPVYPGLQRALDPLSEGTSFLEGILRDVPQILSPHGRLILSHSSCGEREFNQLASKYGAHVGNVLYRRENAYRVEFLNDKQWVDWLVEQDLLSPTRGKDFPFSHSVIVKEISYS